MILSATNFLWFNTVMVLSMAVFWLIWDGRLFAKLWSQRRERQDEFFGTIVGLCILVIGVLGIIRHHLSL